jgi:hypothetical protein
MNVSISANDLAVRDFQKVPETDTRANILQDVVCILFMYVVLERLSALLVEVCG